MVRWIFFIGLLLVVCRLSHCESDSSEGVQACDWTGSGRVTEVSESVGIVALKCLQGKFLWKYPDGAVLIRLKKPRLYSGRPGDVVWRTCLRPVSKQHGATIYRLENGTLSPVVEGKRRRSRVEKCFDTESESPVTLYIEADTSGDQHKSLAGFYYWSKPALRAHQKRSIDAGEARATTPQKCSPCSREEILNAYCSAELVLKGKLVSGDLQESSLKFRVEKLIRKPSDHSDILRRSHPRDNVMEAEVILPAECRNEYQLRGDMHSSGGDFLVLAGSWLGQAHLLCAPLYEDWLSLREEVDRQRRTGRLDVPLECDIRP